MRSKSHIYDVTILEHRLDSFGHVNHAEYVKMFEEARWDVVTKGGHGLRETLDTGHAPVVIELNVKFRKELKLREPVKIETVCVDIRRSLMYLRQRLRNSQNQLCSEAQVTIALLDLHERKLLPPTAKFLQAMGVDVMEAAAPDSFPTVPSPID